MKPSTFTIYNASAGSGKTFTLTKSYLIQLYLTEHPQAFKNILAVTFTNKAANEMKTRILEMLKVFSNNNANKPHAMLLDICEVLNTKPLVIKKKSKIILDHILHNYGAFAISTIDGFNHKLIRSFAYELKVPVNFEVELDTEHLLKKAVDSLVDKAGTDKSITKILIDFALEKTDNDQSWDISYDLNKIATLITNDTHRASLELLKDKTLEDFKALAYTLRTKIDAGQKIISEISNNIFRLIESSGIEHSDFKGGSKAYFPNYFKNIIKKDYKVDYNAQWILNIEEQPLYPKSSSNFVKKTLNTLKPKLIKAFYFSKETYTLLKLHKSLYKNWVPLSVINLISKELDAIKIDENKLLISEFNTLISAEIKDQPTPFIYERIGEKYKHFLVDEFQDTSTLQWENLIPLLDNSLSTTNGSVMLVGDAKQAIYRWRGGNPNQHIKLYTQKQNPFQITPTVKSLNTNYRSVRTIIEFNNDLFLFLSENYLSNLNHQKLFTNTKQKTRILEKGGVTLSFIDPLNNEDRIESYCESTRKSIMNYKKVGYAYSSICVLVRKRKDGVAIANFLSSYNIPVASSESLLLINSEKVNFLNHFLNYILQPYDRSLALECLNFIAKYTEVEDLDHFYAMHLKDSQEKTFTSLKRLGFKIDKTKLLQLPLYEMVEEIIRIFNLNETSDAYLQFYLDVVLNFTEKQQSDATAFLEYFDRQKNKLSVVLPDHFNAVKIMTIHKSKGLEFPVVIFPFADLNIYNQKDPKVWFPVNSESYNGFKKLLIAYNKELQTFNNTGASLYAKIKDQLELDSVNLLYVALTRAKKQMHIISKKDINKAGRVNDKTYAGMFITFLKEKKLWKNEQQDYCFGTITAPSISKQKHASSLPTPFISTSRELHPLNIITKGGLLWDSKQEKAIERGNLLHLILSKIETADDFNLVFENLLISGNISQKIADELMPMVKLVLQHPKLKPYFFKSYTIYNEKDILTKERVILRPDRININSKNEAIIIDYKTGVPHQSHTKQLNIYEHALCKMGYKVREKLIVYLNKNITVVEHDT